MKVVLAEKPSVARELASFLGATQRHDGYYEGKGYQVTWALGHLVTLKEPQDYDPSLKSGRSPLSRSCLRRSVLSQSRRLELASSLRSSAASYDQRTRSYAPPMPAARVN